MSEKPKQPENEFLSNIKTVNPNFVIIEVLEKYKGVLMPETSDGENFEEFLPIKAVGANVKDYKPGDMVYLSHYGRFPIISALGKKYVYCNYMDIIFSSTQEYATLHKNWVKPSADSFNLSKIKRADDLIS